jgi:DNA-binding CsgD family transcriptional regulator
VQGFEAVRKAREIHQMISAAEDSSAFLRVAVHSIFAEHGAVSAYFAVLLNNSQLLVVDSYGYDSIEFSKNALHSVWSNTAANDSIRTGEVLCFLNMQDYLAHYPANKVLQLPGDGFIAIPLWHNGYPLAVLGVAFEHPAPEQGKEPIVEIGEYLRTILEISFSRPAWLEGATNQDALSSVMVAGVNNIDPHAIFVPPEAVLTARQLEVLAGMAEGHTNRQIAYNLHLSESTIGKESIEIYRKLRVNTRKQAVGVARTLALLETELADSGLVASELADSGRA